MIISSSKDCYEDILMGINLVVGSAAGVCHSLRFPTPHVIY